MFDQDFIDAILRRIRDTAAHGERSTGPSSSRRAACPAAQIEELADEAIEGAEHRRLLGDGPHPAPQRGRDHPRDRQLPALPRQHRPPRRRPLPDPRPQQRAGRPHDGDLGEDAGRVPRRARRRVRLRAPARHGVDTVDAIRAMRDGKVDVFFASAATSRPPRPTPGHRGGAGQLRAHRPRRDQAEPLPPVPPGARRSSCPASAGPRGTSAAGGEQFVTVEDSMSMVHASRGHLAPASPTCAARWRSSPASRTRFRRRSRLARDGRDYSVIRKHIEHVVPGFHATRSVSGSPAASSCPAARTTRAASPPLPARRASPPTRSTRRRSPRGTCCCRPSDPTTSSTPPSTAKRPLPRHQRRPAGGLRQRRDSPSSACATVSSSTSSASGPTASDEQRLPHRRVPDRAGVRCRLLPRGERAGPARLDCGGQQHADLQVRRGAPRSRSRLKPPPAVSPAGCRRRRRRARGASRTGAGRGRSARPARGGSARAPPAGRGA